MSRAKHSIEEKLRLVEKVKNLNGVIPRSLARENKISITQIRSWYTLYTAFGLDGLKKSDNKRVSYKIKYAATRDIIEKNLTLQEVMQKYNLRSTTVENWLRIVRKSGYAALQPKMQKNKVKMGRPKKKEAQTELEKLKEENLRLRAENELLKKVQALVEAKNNHIRENWPEPSRN